MSSTVELGGPAGPDLVARACADATKLASGIGLQTTAARAAFSFMTNEPLAPMAARKPEGGPLLAPPSVDGFG